MEGWVGQRGLLEMYTCIYNLSFSKKCMAPNGKHLNTLSCITKLQNSKYNLSNKCVNLEL